MLDDLLRGRCMPENQSGQVTELLQHWKQGDKQALQALIPVVYKELKRLAHYHLQAERADHTLQSTALVHEVYLRLLGKPAAWSAESSALHRCCFAAHAPNPGGLRPHAASAEAGRGLQDRL
jgi:hypothetical protein